jgi:hypothetical protein
MASRCAKLAVSLRKLKESAPIEEGTIIDADLAKNGFQVHGASAGGAKLFRRKLSRQQLARFFAGRD